MRSLGLPGYYHLALFGVLLPYVAIRSGSVLKSRALPTPKARYFIRQIVTLAVLGGISVGIARVVGIPLFPRELPPARSVALGAAILVALVVLMRPRWRRRVAERSRNAWLFMPRTPRERLLWAGCSLAAGISEEITYRGVMFALLWWMTGHALTAALIAAAVFSISHFLQGWTSMAIIFAIALSMQMLAWTSGSLYIGMAVHALYDLAAGLFYGAYGEKLDYPLDPLPPEPA
ncbi:MAG TPA: CPBP family intramembrane glutamic endopeptidase [Candidatus Polarisedimenticolaceae bacterium]|nr:CPBP family intramembrane glutamic endopeptidase [Candidatus Polarisedimenticolaceae bacterium]